jgi:hypothetical protein
MSDATPFLSDSGGIPSSDFAATTDNFTAKNAKDWLNFLSDPDNLKKFIGIYVQVLASTPLFAKQHAGATELIADFLLGLYKVDQAFTLKWLGFEETLLGFLLGPVEALDVTILSHFTDLMQKAFSGSPQTSFHFGDTGIAGSAISLFETFVKPFTLLENTADISQPGSGLSNQAYLLQLALALSLTEKVVDDLGNHFGMGALKTLAPLTGIVDQAINPRNVVRQAMDSSYAFLLKAPVTRDLNRKFPIKDLGVTALAHLRNRGAIDDATYLDKCLDAGLNQTNAQQLLIESSRQISEADIGRLLKNGIITIDDARNLLTQSGYDPRIADTIIHLRTHDRSETIRERVGLRAVSAWVAGKLDKSKMEDILRQTGFTDFEIVLLELEQDFAKTVPESKPLTLAQVKSLFQENIIGIDEVITFLEGEGYSPKDVQNLVLLDFTVAAERQARLAVLISRERVAAQNAKLQAAADQKKNETALADAKKALAAELDAAAATLGQLGALPGILILAGHIP